MRKHIEQSIGLDILQWGVEANMFVHMCDGKNSYGCFNHQSLHIVIWEICLFQTTL